MICTSSVPHAAAATPGGWCGNDLFPEALTPEQRARAIRLVRSLGDRLAKEGYLGFLGIDVLVDLATDEVYLGELNPRISGASSITNVTAGAYADVPLFLFHLLEYTDDWHDVTHEDEAFVLRVQGVGDFRFRGADLGMLFTKGVPAV